MCFFEYFLQIHLIYTQHFIRVDNADLLYRRTCTFQVFQSCRRQTNRQFRPGSTKGIRTLDLRLFECVIKQMHQIQYLNFNISNYNNRWHYVKFFSYGKDWCKYFCFFLFLNIKFIYKLEALTKSLVMCSFFLILSN